MNDETPDQAPEQSAGERLAERLFPSAEEPQVAEQAEEADEDQAEGQAEEQPSAVEEAEIEFEGWKGRLPAKLKAEIDKGADYTRKTQEVADQRRLIEAQQRADHEVRMFQQSAQAEFSELQTIEAQLQQYRGIDLSTMDGETLSRMSMAAANLREKRAELQQAIEAKRGEFKKQLHSHWDHMANQARDAVRRSIPSWDQDAQKVAEWAYTNGFSAEFLTGRDPSTGERVGPGLIDPTFAKALHKAMRYDQLQASKPAALAKASKAAPLLKPGAVDPRSSQQIEHMNFKKAIKNARSDGQKAELIGDRIAKRFNF